MTQNFHPRYAFLGYSFFGLIIAANGFMLTKESEQNVATQNVEGVNASRQSLNESIDSSDTSPSQRDPNESKFWRKLKRNFRQIGQAIVMPEIYLVIVFFIINGLISPDFGDFSYYFMLNVCNVSKFQYSMLGVIGQVTSILGVQFYSDYLRDIEVRKIMYWSTACSVISSLS